MLSARDKKMAGRPAGSLMLEIEVGMMFLMLVGRDLSMR